MAINQKKGFIPKETVFWIMTFSYQPLIFPRFSFTHKKIIKPSVIRKSWVNRYYTYLLADKFIEHKLDEDGKTTWVTLTDKGISAVSGNFFLVKQAEFKTTLFRDICTLSVAIATIIALLDSISKSKEESAKTATVIRGIDSLRRESHKSDSLLNLQRIEIEMVNQTLQNHVLDSSLHHAKK